MSAPVPDAPLSAAAASSAPAIPIATIEPAPQVNTERDRKAPRLTMDAWRQFLQVAKPYWKGDQRRYAWMLMGLLIVLMLVDTQLAVLLNDRSGELTSALAAREPDRFWAAVRSTLWVLAFAVPCYAFYYYMRDAFSNHWRRWLTRRFLDGYLHERRYYELEKGTPLDNPDQRISEDINAFTGRSANFLLVLLGSLMQLVAFSAVLWTLSTALVAFLAVYAFVGTYVALWVFGQPLIQLNFWQLRREADFRFSLMRLRENAESIAFYRGEAQERTRIEARFDAVYDNYDQLIRRQRSLNMYQRAFSQLTLVIPAVILANGVLSGELEVGRAVQAAGAFAAVLSSVSLIVDNFESLSRFVAGIGRLHALASEVMPEVAGPLRTARARRDARRVAVARERARRAALKAQAKAQARADAKAGRGAGAAVVPTAESAASVEAAGAEAAGATTALNAGAAPSIALGEAPAPPAWQLEPLRQNGIRIETGATLALEHVSLCTPRLERLLVRDLALQVPEGEGLLITGVSGCGKSSLLRGIAGLWRAGRGVVRHPVGQDVFFLPQRPYMQEGTLRSQMIYPATTTTLSDAQLLAMLDVVQLPNLAERFGGLDSERDWGKVLSIGEQQRLAFARVLVRRPKLVILDEATSALDNANEASLYGHLRQQGCTMVSVAHRPALLRYHTQVLNLKGDGEWELLAAPDFRFAE